MANTAPSDLETLWELAPPRGAARGASMPEILRTRYGGRLDVPVHEDRPTLLVNFVTTLDGVVALGRGEEPGGGVISGFFAPDRFVMALVRAVADVLLVGSGTIAGTSSGQWTAEHLAPDLAPALRDWRRSMGLAPKPTTVIVTGSGDVRLGRRGLEDPEVPVVFATTARGAERLRTLALPDHATIEVAGATDHLTPEDLGRLISRWPRQVVLSEGGPHLLGALVAADTVDEYFLTLSPQVIGRTTPDSTSDRLGLVEGIGLDPREARWQAVQSVKRSGDHLFLRYRRRS
jgi:riboflavin biosynthesis pyrimidine reductase